MELYDRCDLLITIKTVHYETIVLNIVFDFAWWSPSYNNWLQLLPRGCVVSYPTRLKRNEES